MIERSEMRSQQKVKKSRRFKDCEIHRSVDELVSPYMIPAKLGRYALEARRSKSCWKAF